MSLDLIVAVIAAIGFGWCYYRLFKGTGLVIGVALEVVVGIVVLNFPAAGIWIALGLGIAAFGLEFRHQKQRKAYLGAKMAFEGGGIRRGLTPVHTGVLFERENRELLQLGLIEALGAGTIVLQDGDEIGFRLADHLVVENEIVNPVEKRAARKQAGRVASQVISGTDDILLELVRQHKGEALSTLQAGIWLERVAEETGFALTGFDLNQTRSYYDAYMSHRLMGVVGDYFVAEVYLGWMMLAEMTGVLSDEAIAVVAGKIRPGWLPEGVALGEWLERLGKAA